MPGLTEDVIARVPVLVLRRFDFLGEVKSIRIVADGRRTSRSVIGDGLHPSGRVTSGIRKYVTFASSACSSPGTGGPVPGLRRRRNS